MPDLQLSSISKKFVGAGTDSWALRDVSLTIKQGEFVAIEGPSGAGKSTLLNILGMLDTPTEGEYTIDGVRTDSLSSVDAARRRSVDFSFVFQSFHLLARRPVIDSVELALVYRGVPANVRRRKALNALDRVGLRSKAALLSNKLSGGEQQRVAIARALAADSPIIVADEPTGNLDTKNSASIVDNLRLLHREGCTVILVTHSSEVAAAADRRIHVVDGRIVADTRMGGLTAAVLPERHENGEHSDEGRPSHVRALDLVRDAVASVRSRVGRSLMLVLAVALGVGLTVATLGISSAATIQVNSTFNAHTNKDVSATWSAYKLRSVESAARESTIASRLKSLAGTTGAAVINELDVQPVTLGAKRGTYSVDVYSVTGSLEKAARATIRWAPHHIHAVGVGETLVGSDIAKTLQLGPLAGVPVIRVHGHPFVVAGIITQSPRVVQYLGGLMVGSQSGRALAAHPVQSTALIETVAGAAPQVAHQVPFIINPYQPQQVSVSAPSDPSTLRSQIERSVQLSLVIVTLIALIGAVVGLANAMVLAVVERRQEFGLRRAIGARGIHVLTQTIVESSCVGFVGGVVGLAGGLIAVLVITIANRWEPTFDLRLAPVAVLGGVVVGALGGTLAAVQATLIRPSDALRL